ncbi:hypothetical protein SAMN02927937_00079 [Paenimyroides aquimaris]|uniref:Uncharacterized protein n=1 Tax=Paenimyroides marinum TaxID=1159016 RepID=A0A1H6IXJ9_9FLAO|nr:hypothetical protein SAMN02927937_00079 [Paenimyroides aquimaris]
MLKKILLYTVIYMVISFVMSYDEIQCAFDGEGLCWYNLIGKYIIFILLILVFDQFIRPKIFKR